MEKPLKIILVHPYVTSRKDTGLCEPLGLISIATYIKSIFNNTISIEILDLFALGKGVSQNKDGIYINGLKDETFLKNFLNTKKPDIIGIQSNFTTYSHDSLEIAKISKSVCPNSLVLLGGAHVSMDSQKILENNFFVDLIIRGEGEITFKEIIDKKLLNQPFETVDGLTLRSNNQIIMTKDRELIPDINILPILERSYIDVEFYKKMNEKMLPFTKNVPAATIMTSRGCPFNCIFCSTKMMWKRKWRPLSYEKVIQEIEQLVKNYGIKEIAIMDDQFIIDKKRVIRICEYLISQKLAVSLSIPSGTSIWLVDEELLRKMKDAGFYRLSFPIESGNAKTLSFIRKPINLGEVKQKIALANRIGYWTTGNFIIGFPYETHEEIEETIQYACNSGLDYAIFFIAKPYAGAELTDIFIKEGLMKDFVQLSDIEHSDISTKYFSSAQLNKYHQKAYRKFLIYKIIFYLNPLNFYRYMVPKLRSSADIRYALCKILLNGVRMKIR